MKQEPNSRDLGISRLQAGEQVKVTMRHMRRLNYCSSGVRRFFAEHGLDYGQFLREGIPAEELMKTGDAMAIRVAEVANGQQKEADGRI